MKVYKLHHVRYIGIIAFDFRYVLHSQIGKGLSHLISNAQTSCVSAFKTFFPSYSN